MLDAFGPIDPTAARGSLAAPKITGVRVQAIGDHLVHAVTARPPIASPPDNLLDTMMLSALAVSGLLDTTKRLRRASPLLSG